MKSYNYHITQLSSFHITGGKCNPNELYRIIESIQPEVIFEELPLDIFNFVYAEGRNPESLEAITIKSYLRNYSIKHFPVDTYPKDITELLDVSDIAKKSNEYVLLWKEFVKLIQQDGYTFINSMYCTELQDKIRFIEEKVLKEINNPNLLRNFDSENLLHHNRENEMLRNIYNLSKIHSYNKALLICGAQHRKPFIEKIKEYQKRDELKLNWTYYGIE